MFTDEIKLRWAALLTNPDWYLAILPELEELRKQWGGKSDAEQEPLKIKLYDFFAEHLVAGDIALDNNPANADAERKPIDTIIIHHTSNPPGMTKELLSGMELIRLYAPEFAAPKYEADKKMKGRPICSGHFRDGHQVFWPYHWFVRRDGTAERLLNDDEIGWQAGDWDINCRSVAICFDGDFENSRPSDIELSAAASIIKDHYPQVARECIFGHREINLKTTCPSNLFLSDSPRRGWKDDLLELLFRSNPA
jgi:hypothetical protein